MNIRWDKLYSIADKKQKKPQPYTRIAFLFSNLRFHYEKKRRRTQDEEIYEEDQLMRCGDKVLLVLSVYLRMIPFLRKCRTERVD